jgi:hypothetical protein
MAIELITLAMLASAGVSAAGSIYGGISAKRTGELNAFSTKTESILAKAQGVQQANMRNTAFKEAMSAADAIFYAAGRVRLANLASSLLAFFGHHRLVSLLLKPLFLPQINSIGAPMRLPAIRL